jgi:hypothetical protein
MRAVTSVGVSAVAEALNTWASKGVGAAGRAKEVEIVRIELEPEPLRYGCIER